MERMKENYEASGKIMKGDDEEEGRHDRSNEKKL